VVTSCHLGPCCQHTRWCLRGWWKQALIGWYEVSCSLLLISLLAWVLERLNGRLPSTLLMANWFVCPLSVGKCYYCKSFLWNLSHFLFIPLLKWWFGCSQVHTKPWTCKTYIHSSCKMLMNTYLKEYNKFETRVFVVHTFFVIFLYANGRMHGFRIVQHRFCLSCFMCLLYFNMVQGKDNLQQKISDKPWYSQFFFPWRMSWVFFFYCKVIGVHLP
jgi:hypothetical protein